MAYTAAGVNDEYTAYERGLSQLLSILDRNSPRYSDALIFEQRLNENIVQSRRYGATGTYKADRAVIVSQLNGLALSELGESFNDLCASATEDKSQSLLVALPLNLLPDYGSLPSGSRMPISRNPLFTGRADDLRALASVLKSSGTAAVAAATGLGGIGKTQLAAEFVHRYGQFFAGGVFWLSFADPEIVPMEVAECGLGGGLDLNSEFKNMRLSDQIELVIQAWEQPIPRLLIFDNCEDETLLAQWRRATGGCRLLITSRRAEWDAALGVREIALGVLPRHESVALLGKFLPLAMKDQVRVSNDQFSSASDLNAIADELGDLPLALHLAGSYLKNNRYDVAPHEYLGELRSADLLKHPSLEGEDLAYSATKHILHVGRTFALSYNQLDATKSIDGLALKVLACGAYFAPGEPIPRNLLWISQEVTLDKRLFGKALRQLANLGLLTEEKAGDLRLHRLLAKFVRALLPDTSAQTAVEWVLYKEANRLNKAGIPAPLLALQAHLRTATDTAMKREDELAGLLCSTMGFFLNMIGEYSLARSYCERAVAIRRSVLGERHPDTALSLNNLGALLQMVGDYSGARLCFEQALAISRNIRSEDDPDTALSFNNLRALSLNNLGSLLQALGDYANARPCFEQALEIRRATLGARHSDTANSLDNLGSLLQMMGDYASAQPCFEQALDIRRDLLGEWHPDTATSLNNLGNLLQAIGDYAGARPYFQQALDIRRTVLGERHPDTAISLNNLGYLFQALADYSSARVLYEQALKIRRTVLGERHLDTAISLNNLGYLLQAMGDYAGARPYFQQALDIRRTVLGEHHPDTATSLNNLGALLRAIGDLSGARSCYEQALEIRRATLGEQHPDIALSLYNISILCFHESRFQESLALMKEAHSIWERALGSEHPNTKTSLENMAKVQKRLAQG